MNAHPATSAASRGDTRPAPVSGGPPGAVPASIGPGSRSDLLIDALPGAVVVLDRDGIVTESNPEADALFRARLAARRWRDVVAEHFDPRGAPGPDARMRDGRLVSIATRSLGPVPGQILLLTDVTETRELERRLRGLERLSDMGRMMAKLAHQLRTPLAAALLDASNLRAGEPRGGPRREMHDRVIERLRDLERLVDELLAFARQGRLEVAPLELGALLDATRERLAPAVGAAGAALEVEREGGPLHVEGNATALASSLESMVSNAVQAGARRVVLGARAAGQGVAAVRVRDDGPGVAAAERGRIFDPFVTTRPEGSGLGLALARAVAEAHDGQLALERTGPAGSVFRLDLPLAAAEAAA